MAGRPRNQAASAAILAAAIEILRERGYDGLTLDAVVRVSGVGKSSLYARYSGRAELAAAAVAGLQRELPPARGELRLDMIVWLRAAERNLGQVGPQAASLLMAGGTGRTILGPVLDRIGRRLALAQGEGAIDAEADLEAAADLLGGALLGRVLLGAAEADQWPERAVDCLLAALVPRTSHGSR